MLELLQRGPGDDAEFLTLTAIHEHLAKALPSKGFPQPEQRNTRTIGNLALARRPPPADTDHPLPADEAQTFGPAFRRPGADKQSAAPVSADLSVDALLTGRTESDGRTGTAPRSTLPSTVRRIGRRRLLIGGAVAIPLTVTAAVAGIALTHTSTPPRRPPFSPATPARCRRWCLR